MRHKVKCGWCGQEFEPLTEKHTYCCKECYRQSNNHKRREARKIEASKKVIRCIVCNEPYTRKTGNQKFCSQKCKNEAERMRRGKGKRTGGQKPSVASNSDNLNPYEMLANAIIKQAVDDYRNSVYKLELEPHNTVAQGQIDHIERFFRSEYFSLLTDIDPNMLISKLRAESEEG